MKNTLESTNGATEVSRTALAVKFFIWVLLLGAIVSIPLWYVFGTAFSTVLGVSLALATLCVLAVLDGGWFGSTPGMTILGLIVAIPVWLVFDTGLVSVLAISLALGLLHPLLKGKEYREEARRRQQQARLREPIEEQIKPEQEESEDGPSWQDGAAGRAIPIRPHELRAMSYPEYLQSPHWKRRREDKLRAVGHRCQVCNRGSGTLDVHHRTYERLGEELDEDLTVLCRDCHSVFHDHRRLSR